MTTTSTSQTVTKAPATKKTRKPVEKRGFNEVGKFFAKVRIDLGLTSEQWAKQLKVSASFVNNVERGEKAFDLDFVNKVNAIILPQHHAEFASLVAEKLNVLVIPTEASNEQVQRAYNALVTPVATVEA